MTSFNIVSLKFGFEKRCIPRNIITCYTTRLYCTCRRLITCVRTRRRRQRVVCVHACVRVESTTTRLLVRAPGRRRVVCLCPVCASFVVVCVRAYGHWSLSDCECVCAR